jgi:hypothetical protein
MSRAHRWQFTAVTCPLAGAVATLTWRLPLPMLEAWSYAALAAVGVALIYITVLAVSVFPAARTWVIHWLQPPRSLMNRHGCEEDEEEPRVAEPLSSTLVIGPPWDAELFGGGRPHPEDDSLG